MVVVYRKSVENQLTLAFYRGNSQRIEPLRTKCALYTRQCQMFFYTNLPQCVENVQDNFHIVSFPSSNSSSPVAVAHECCMRSMEIIIPLLAHCIPLCIRS